jgi:dolichyl-phosphate-mannose--protein O-mannosyl transferase
MNRGRRLLATRGKIPLRDSPGSQHPLQETLSGKLVPLKKQWIWATLLLCTSLSVRLAFLDSPNEVIFDEVHWGKYVTAYAHTGSNLFDVHPPHGKLLVTALLKITGYDGQQNFDKIGTPLTHVSALTIRILPALAGSLVPFTLFLIFLHFGIRLESAFVFSLCSALDNALVLQSRVMGLYPMFLFALVSSLYFALKSQETEGARKILFLAACGIACGFAAGLQLTGITAPAVVFFVLTVYWLKKAIPLKGLLFQWAMVSFMALAVYLIGWKIHFLLLPNPGFGDAFYRNTGAFWTDLVELHKHMYRFSGSLTTSHPDASPAWSWLFMTRPIFYWQAPRKSLYFLGNPAVWWGVTFLFAWNCGKECFRKNGFESDLCKIALFAVTLSYVPLALMTRVLFLYHFLIPLTYAALFVGATAEEYTRKNFPWMIALIVIGFLYLSPVTYGFSMPHWYWDWLPWRLAH